MPHLPFLLRDLALVLICAGTVSVVFRRLGQPLILGYLLAGLIVGPGFPHFPTVVDLQGIQTLAEMGMIFFLFGLGLEFKVTKILELGPRALVTALVEVSTLLILGFGASRLLGWSTIDGIYLAGILAISSTTVILRTLQEMKLRQAPFTRFLFGVLVFEDLVAVVLMLVLTALASSREVDFTAPALKFIGFIALIYPLGLILVPRLLRRLRNSLDEETLLISALGLCFSMVFLASQAGLSAALGAFLMGSILASSEFGARIEHGLHSLQMVFGAIFFVSIGILIQPMGLWNNLGTIVFLSLIVIAGKFGGTLLGCRLAGADMREGLKIGLCLTQIGEFSFLMASIGVATKATSDFVFPVAIGVAVVTAFTTPYVIRGSSYLERKMFV